MHTYVCIKYCTLVHVITITHALTLSVFTHINNSSPVVLNILIYLYMAYTVSNISKYSTAGNFDHPTQTIYS